jgi:nitroimidazol reductase NimA-like FMN-containing flavoprotein (pyridoxamine 5'-phosphate oxidase superfamily)
MIGKLTGEQIEDVLMDNVMGHIGFNDGRNNYVYPTHFVYDGSNIICHAQLGFKIQAMRKNKRVCLQVDEIKKDMNWKSVLVHGNYQELEEERDRQHAMKLFVDRYLHLKIKESTILPNAKEDRAQGQIQEHSKAVFYRIIIDEKTGRFEKE